MLGKIRDYVKTHNMIEKGDRIVAGVSGGADSICLLYILKELCGETGAELVAAHVNHGIRGEEADRDEQFVRNVCNCWGIELYSYSFDVKRLAREEGASEEETGRKVRYQAFFEVCRLHRCNKIAIAHNKNDNAETYLFNLFRGTGIKGLTGIAPVRTMVGESMKVTIIRPLLCAERSEIEAFLSKEGIGFCTDSTNLTLDYSRNRIRNHILSYASDQINAQAVANINEAAEKLLEAWEYIEDNIEQTYDRIVKQEGRGYRVVKEELLREPAVLRKGVIRRIFENLAGSLKDLETVHVESVLSLCEKQVGKTICLPYGIIAESRYTDISLYCSMDNTKSRSVRKIEPITVAIPGRTQIPGEAQKAGLGKWLVTEVFPYEKNKEIPKSDCIKWFDYDKIENAVQIRNRKEGDYICINAAGGNKKLKDYFIDLKIPKRLRDEKLLVADGSHIMWIFGDGDRISEKYKVDKTTKRVLLMKLIDLEDNNDDR